MKNILTIAGSDSGGGAGIQADIKTITLLGGYAMSVITALTAQNSLGVQDIQPIGPEFIEKQLDSVLSDIGADSVKTGMLFDAPAISAVAYALRKYEKKLLVVDPVMSAQKGNPLAMDEAFAALVKEIIPISYVITPNLIEAEKLSQKNLKNNDNEIKEAARIIHGLGARNVLIKGGHRQGAALDILYDGRDFYSFEKKRINTQNTHGTGCTYSAAIATLLAQGHNLIDAVAKAKDFIHSAIQHSFPLGKGCGTTNPAALYLQEQERQHVLVSLQKGLLRLKSLDGIAHLVPEVQINFGFALPYAETASDVAAFPGRIVRVKERVVAVECPCFGGSQHIAAVILAVMQQDPIQRAAINIKFSDDIIAWAIRLGWKVSSFDRTLEPDETQAREGSTLEWGTEAALSQQGKIPDIIFDRGGQGKEPMIRLLGKDPD
ncbi:MAG: bifunctional hydroxymethylpyrimidine kinase/phosphomethylpyrimidine kinase, partial [Pseudomonadota bacterium]